MSPLKLYNEIIQNFLSLTRKDIKMYYLKWDILYIILPVFHTIFHIKDCKSFAVSKYSFKVWKRNKEFREIVLTRESSRNCAARSKNRADTGEQWPNKSDVIPEDTRVNPNKFPQYRANGWEQLFIYSTVQKKRATLEYLSRRSVID